MTRTGELLAEALGLPEVDRRVILEQLPKSLPPPVIHLYEDDPDLLQELERRFQDRAGMVSEARLWQ